MSKKEENLELRIDGSYFKNLSKAGDNWSVLLENDLKKFQNKTVFVGSPSVDKYGLYSDVRSLVAGLAIKYGYAVAPADKSDIPVYKRLWMNCIEYLNNDKIRYKFA